MEISPSYASTYIRDLSVNTLQIQGNAVTVPIGSIADTNRRIGASHNVSGTWPAPPTVNSSVWLKSSAWCGPITWRDYREKPSALIISATANIRGEGSSSNYVSRYMQVIMSTNSAGTSNRTRVAGIWAQEEVQEFDDCSLTLIATIPASSYNYSTGTNLYFRIEVAFQGDASPSGILRTNGISVMAAKK